MIGQLAASRGVDLAVAAELSRGIIETSHDIVAVLDERHAVVSVGPAIERMLGYTQHECLGRNVLELVHPESRDAFSARLDDPSSRGTQDVIEVRLQHHDGSWRTMEATTAAASFNGCLRVVTFRDVTARQQLEEQLRQAQRMESVGRLASGVAHDFNNILTAILSCSVTLLEQLPAQDPLSHVADEIVRAVRRATSLTGQLLAFSRQRPLQPRVLDLNQCIGNVCAMLRRLIGHNVKLVVRLAPEAVLVRADPSQIEQLIVNLAINARDAMPQGGQLTVETRHVTVSRAGDGSPVRPGDYVRLAVSDTGCGMSKATMGRIFEPFFTTKEEGRGTGLGLAMVYSIVVKHRGVISVDSAPGEGSTFTIDLPRVEAGPDDTF